MTATPTDQQELDEVDERARQVAEHLDGALAWCEATGIPDASFLRITMDLPASYVGRFPSAQLGRVRGGILTFPVPAGVDGRGHWELDGVARGELNWTASAVGELAPCTSFVESAALTMVHGAVVELDGTPAEAGSVEGCGGRAHIEQDGTFAAVVESGLPCTLRAIRRANMAVAYGEPVEVAPVAGVDVDGVVLVAPNKPAWREPTAEEDARQMAELCSYWSGKRAEQVARVRAMLPAGDMLDNLLDELEEQRRESESLLCDPDAE